MPPAASDPIPTLTSALLGCEQAFQVTFSQLGVNYVAHYEANNLANYFITRLDLCKGKRSPYHEYVLAHVSLRCGESLQPRGILRAERTMPMLDKSSSKTTSKIVSEVSCPSNILAADQVKICGISEVGKAPILCSASRFNTTGRTCPIDRFIAAGLAIGKVKPNYDVFGEQCYWFAGVFFELLAGFDEDAAKILDRRRKKKVLGVSIGSKHTPGSFGLLQLVTLGQLREDSQLVAPIFSKLVDHLESRLSAKDKQSAEKVCWPGDQLTVVVKEEEKEGRTSYADCKSAYRQDCEASSLQSCTPEESEAPTACSPSPSPPPSPPLPPPSPPPPPPPPKTLPSPRPYPRDIPRTLPPNSSDWSHGPDPSNDSPRRKKHYDAGPKTPQYDTEHRYR